MMSLKKAFSPQNFSPLFVPVDPNEKTELQNADLLFKSQLYCGSTTDNGIIVTLGILDDCLILQDGIYGVLQMRFDFNIKIQILRVEQAYVKSKIIGFKLISETNSSQIIFYDQNYQNLKNWVNYLKRKINILDFSYYFKPHKKIGSGQFACVYWAKDCQNQKNYAVKAFKKIIAYQSSSSKQVIMKQIQILRRVNHCNVLRLEGVYESQNSLYIVTELLEGTMKDKIPEINTEKQIKSIIYQLLKGLQYLKLIGIVHRDLKFENIMFRVEGRGYCPVIIDFGLGAILEKEKYDKGCGTPGYLPPEIFQTEPKVKLSEKRDIFSLGIIFYAILNKQMLFKGTDVRQVFRNNRNQKIDLAQSKYVHLSKCVLRLLKRMLHQDPKDRISCEEALKHEYFLQNSKDQDISPCDTIRILEY